MESDASSPLAISLSVSPPMATSTLSLPGSAPGVALSLIDDDFRESVLSERAPRRVER